MISAAAINTDAVKIGTNGIDIPTSYDAAQFDIVSLDLASDEEGRMGCYVYINTFVDTASIFSVYKDVNNNFELEMEDPDDLRFTWIDNSTGRNYLESAGVAIGTGTWYFLEIAWKTSTNYREIFVDGTSRADTTADTIGNFAVDPNELNWGNRKTSAEADFYLDQCMVSNDIPRDLNNLKGLPAYPG